MQVVVDINVLKDNLKTSIADKLFNWIDIRDNFNNMGINTLQHVLNIDNIGLFTDSLEDAITIRNFNKYIPIIVSRIERTEQVFDIIMNNLTLSIDDLDTLNEINKLNIKDKLSIVLLIKSDDYEDGISVKGYYKAKEIIKSNNYYIFNGLYTFVSNEKSKNLDDFKNIVSLERSNSFCIGSKEEFTSSGFISKELKKGVISIHTPILKAYKLNGNTCFGGKKIKKECYGIKLKAPNFKNKEYHYINIDSEKWKIVNYVDDILYLIGNISLKTGKKIDLTNYYLDSIINYQISFQLNGKMLEN